MTTEAAVRRLVDDLAELSEAVHNAHLTVSEDRPTGPGAQVADHLDDQLTELVGLVEEALDAAGAAVAASEAPVEVDHLRRALARCHSRQLAAGEKLHADVMTVERHANLRRLGRERGMAWTTWARMAGEALDQCAPAFVRVDRDLLDCWNTLVERTAPLAVPRPARPPTI